jgi:hypothetical protein
MALNSPGAQVTVIDESFYTPAGAGTTPLIFVTSRKNKSNASGTGTAVGTLDTNIGKVYTITSQRDLTDTFGTPVFETKSGNPVHGGELNEYGLQTAYTALGVTSKVYVARAGIDLAQLTPNTSIPSGTPSSGAYWLDSDNSLFGIFQWDAINRIFVNKTPSVIIDDNTTATNLSNGLPLDSLGKPGEFAVVISSSNENTFFYKNDDGNWVIVGSNKEPKFGSITIDTFTSTSWISSIPAAVGTVRSAITQGTAFKINGSQVVVSADTSSFGIAKSINQSSITGVGAKWEGTTLKIFADSRSIPNGANRPGELVISATASNVLYNLGLSASTSTTSTTYGGAALTIQPHTKSPDYVTGNNASGSIYIKTTTPNSGSSWLVKSYNATTNVWSSTIAPIYADTASAIKALDTTGGKNIPVGIVFVQSNYDGGTGADGSPKLAQFKLFRKNSIGATTISGTVTSSTHNGGTITIAETVIGSNSYANTTTITVSAGSYQELANSITNADPVNITAEYKSDTKTFSITHKLGGDFKIAEAAGTMLSMFSTEKTANLYDAGEYDTAFTWRASNWKPLVYRASASSPSIAPDDGTLWYTPTLDAVDIMYHNGSKWVGYLNQFPNSDPNGPIISATMPKTQSDGSSLVDGDIWISTAEPDRYGMDIYLWNGFLATPKWVLQDVADQTTPNGWLFADARWATSGSATAPSTIVDLLSSNYVDPDSPDPDSYPGGMRLWNLRRSGNNVKKYVSNHINIEANDGKNIRYNNESMASYSTARWITASPNTEDGSGSFARNAQRSIIVKELKSLIDTSQAIRDTDTLVFNLIATPGYTECIANMVSFNMDRGQTAFVIGDTPFRLPSSGTDISNWATNANSVLNNGDEGAVTYDEYMAMFYPSGFTTDNFGNNIVVPPSHMMIRTFITSDQKGYQWFAPAGIRRGGVDSKVTAVGYLKDGEFQVAPLPQGIRDVMYQTAKINPIATIPGSGIVNFGNLTRAKSSSSLDRINVARLVCYLRRQLDILSRPYLFEPNDKTTRNEIKAAAESFLLELVGQRALYDFIVVCDESNNTNERIDRSELWMDIAVEPVKAVEFIYIPLRLKKTGSIAAGI